MKVLYLTAQAPYAPHRGDALIAYNQLRHLAGRAEVHLLSYVSSAEEADKLQKALGADCASITTVLDTGPGRYLRLLRTPFNFCPLQVNLYTCAAMRHALDKLIRELHVDLVHIQTMRMARMCEGLSIPCVVDFIDALSMNMTRRADQENRVWLRPLLRIEALLSRRYEQRLLKRFNGFSVVSGKDRDWLGEDSVCIIPCGTGITAEVLKNYEHVQRQPRFIFHGNMYYFPNVDGVRTIARDIWPSLHKRYPHHAFYVVGHKPASEIVRLNNRDNIVVTGSVDDMVAELCAAEIGIYWLNSGSGLQNKILEALACGLPVVATPLAVQGIPGLTRDHLVLAETPEAFIEAVEGLMGDPGRRAALSAAGQAFIRENYSWEGAVNALLALWNEACSDAGETRENAPA